MSGKKVSLLINPRNGQNISKLQDMLSIFAAAGWKTGVSLKEYGKHVMKLANEAVIDKNDLIIAYGGDGTLNQAVNGVISAKGKQSVVGLIPGGTANVWAGEVGVPTDPVKAALTLVNSEVRKVDVGRFAVSAISFPGENETRVVEMSRAGKKATKASRKVRHHFLLMAGIGIDAAVMQGVSKPLKYQIGPFAVGLSAAKELAAPRPFPIELYEADKQQPLWVGEVLQIIAGNSRRYAKMGKITPDAYIDDGSLDLCVITTGTPLNTIQQLTSLLLRQKPDHATAEYFHGAHLRLKVPATVPLQVDGSAVKLKDYLSAEDYARFEAVEQKEQVLITYRLDTLPQALEIAIPRAYDDELFAHNSAAAKQGDEKPPQEKKDDSPESVENLAEGDVALRSHRHLFVHHHTEADNVRLNKTEAQAQTLTAESRPESQLGTDTEELHKHGPRRELSAAGEQLLKKGREVTVIGRVPDPARAHTYIIAGRMRKSDSGETMPCAVVVGGKTTIADRDKRPVDNVEQIVRELADGDVMVVVGKRSKYNVLHARHIVLA